MTDSTREHLRTLSTFHYVVGGLGYLFSLFPIFHLAMGLFFLLGPEDWFVPPQSGGTPAIHGEGAAAPDSPEIPIPGAAPVSLEIFPTRLIGTIFTAVAAVIILGGFVFSTLIVVTGRRLAAYRSHKFCLVMAGIECLFAPFGTVLGVFTLLTLLKPEAQLLFGLPPIAPRPSV